MGNTGATGGGWLYSEEATQILLRFQDARSVGLSGDERLSGVVGGERMWSDVPVQLPVTSSTGTLSIDFQVVLKGREAKGGRSVGEVLLPLEYIATRCGGSLYHMWLPLQQKGQELYSAQPEDKAPFEYFERALRNAARDPRCPVVCLSVGQVNTPQALEWYDFNATSAEKSTRFYSLLQSHAQHARLLQALYRQCRAVQQARVDRPAHDSLEESWVEPAGRRHDPERVSAEAGMPRMLRPNGAGAAHEEAARLRQEIESTTEEANARINQASDAIRTLKERLAARQAEHERLRRETSDFCREAECLEGQNEQLAVQFQQRPGPSGAPDGRQEELLRLQREARMLGEQKDALMQILDDLYSAAGKENPQMAQTTAQPSKAPSILSIEPQHIEQIDVLPRMGSTASQAPEPGFQNLLPRPSRLFEDGGMD